MAEVSELVSAQQKATRRRALGRKLVKNASDVRITAAGIRDSNDLIYLTGKESQAVAKLLKGLDNVATGFDKLGVRLEDKR